MLSGQLQQNLPALDLHGLFPSEVLDKLELFLYTQYQAREQAVRIIYGIGEGKQRGVILGCLHSHPLTKALQEEVGSCILLFAY